jgi:hypothetical protein
MIAEKQIEQLMGIGTKKDHRSKNKKTIRLLRALAIELKDLPCDMQKRIDYIVNDLSDGYDFNWIGAVEHNRCFLK